jgi:hypothetical protein
MYCAGLLGEWGYRRLGVPGQRSSARRNHEYWIAAVGGSEEILRLVGKISEMLITSRR